jgi:hypothetical protein
LTESTSTTLRDTMRTDEQFARLLEKLEQVGPPAEPVVIPTDAEVEDLLTLLGAPAEDIPDVIAARPLVVDNPEAMWLLERHVSYLHQYTGVIGVPHYFVEIPAGIGDLSRFFYLYVYLCAYPAVRRYHASLGIPDDISLATLSDLGRNMRVNRKRRGTSGLAAPWWCMLHFRGMIYQLGRLQFELVRLNDAFAESIIAHGGEARPGDTALSIHIPDFMGPFTPEAIDDSITRAKRFFPGYFPGEKIEYGTCWSWLLDDQLPHHLSPASNIVRFQKRFTIVSQGERNDSGTALFIWGSSSIPDAPRDGASSLERAIIAHHQAGGHWGSGAGWLRL